MTSEFESHLRDTVNWGKKWLIDFSAVKTQLVLDDQSNNVGAIDVKIDGSVLEEKSSFKMVGLTFSSKLDWDSYIILIAKTNSKIGAFFSLRLLCISTNRPYGLAWNISVMSGMVLLAASWNCWISYKNGFAGLLVSTCSLS